MKRTLSRRLIILITGVLFALLAGMGLSAPAVASPVQVAAAGNYYDHGADLTLEANRDGRHITLKVVGENYDSKWVSVKVVEFKHNGKDRVIDYRDVKTEKGHRNGKGDFRYQIKNAECGHAYQAYSSSNKDGYDRSEKIWIKCDWDRH